MQKIFKIFFCIFIIYFLINKIIFATDTKSVYLYNLKKKEIIKYTDELVIKYNFNKNKLLALFKTVKLHDDILKSIQHPFESQPWYLYKKNFLTQNKINNGIIFYKKYHTALEKAEKIYGVPASMIVAIIGIESDYGKSQGKYLVLDALSNLAFNYKPRSQFFQSELKEFLILCREKNLNPRDVYGSYAGAIGQAQFMPSSFRVYAIKFGKDKKTIDLTHNTYDVIGSIANYFNKHGWEKNGLIAKYAILKKEKIKSLPPLANEPHYHLKDLINNGLIPKEILRKNLPCMYLQLENDLHKPEFWIGFKNFYVITRYNTSILYAMAAFRLSEEINKYANLKNFNSSSLPPNKTHKV